MGLETPMSSPKVVVQVPKIALRIGDVAIALGLNTAEVRNLLEFGFLPPPRIMLRERFWLRSDLEGGLERGGHRTRYRWKSSGKGWQAK